MSTVPDIASRREQATAYLRELMRNGSVGLDQYDRAVFIVEPTTAGR